MKLILMTFFCFANNMCDGQFIEVKGRVTDDNSNPIPAATILCTKSKSVSWTRQDGTYVVITPYRNDTIVCSHIGFGVDIEAIEGNSTINFRLQRQAKEPYAVTLTYCNIDTTKDQRRLEDSLTYKAWLAGQGSDCFSKVEIASSYPGGHLAFQKNFETTFSIGDYISNSRITGVIKLGLVIAKDGSVAEVTLLKGINESVDEAVIKTIKNMPCWFAAEQNGRKVKSYKEVSVSFENICRPKTFKTTSK